MEEDSDDESPESSLLEDECDEESEECSSLEDDESEESPSLEESEEELSDLEHVLLLFLPLAIPESIQKVLA